MTEYKVWAYARSAAPNLPALEDQLAEVMREADRRGYIIVNSCMEQKYGTEFWRPALFAMLTAVQQGRVNAVMVQSLDRLSHDLTTLYHILRFLQNHGAVLITTRTNLRYELYLTGLEGRLLQKSVKNQCGVPWQAPHCFFYLWRKSQWKNCIMKIWAFMTAMTECSAPP